jgi:hypothetical protein
VKRCEGRIFIKSVQKFLPCVRIKGHSSTHSADFTGEKFGLFTVIKLGKPKYYSRLRELARTWVVEMDGMFKTVLAHHLVTGKFKGENPSSGFCHKKGKVIPEFATVSGHLHLIRNLSMKAHKNYRGMPFFDAWNPDKGGKIWLGAKWIIDNLGEKPGDEWSLDIVEHVKGFVPGNLRWAKREIQKRNQRHKKLGLYDLSEIRIEAKRLGYKLVKT